MESQCFPEFEHLLVAQQNIAARLHVVLLLDPSPCDRFSDFEPLLRLDECDIVNQEDCRFFDPFQFLDGLVRADRPVAATVKSPGAAEGAIPGAAARKLDGGAGVQNPDEILVPVPE